MSSKTPVNNPTPAEAALRQKVKQAAKERFVLRKGRQQSKAANEARRLNAAKSEWKKSSDTSYAGAASWALAKAPAKAEPNAPAPAKAQPKAPASAPAKSIWTKAGGAKKKKSKAKAKKAWVPPDQYIASLKKQVRVLNQRKTKAKHDKKPEEAERFQRQINTLWGKMKRAEDRQRQNGSRRWNNQHGGLRKKHPLADYVKAAKAAKPK